MKISIITIVFNNAQYIRDSIESVLDQGHQSFDLEYIVVDGASTDGTLEIINEYNDKITHIISEKDCGIYEAINKGIGCSTGDVIGLLHSDDIFADRFILQKIFLEFSQNPDIDGVYGDLQYVNKDIPAKVIRNWQSGDFSLKALKKGWMPPHPTLYLKKSVFDNYGKYDLEFKIASDYEFMMRILHKGTVKLSYIPEVLIKMRVGGASNKSIKNIYQKSYEDYKAMRRYKIGGPGTLLAKNLRKLPQFLRGSEKEKD